MSYLHPARPANRPSRWTSAAVCLVLSGGLVATDASASTAADLPGTVRVLGAPVSQTDSSGHAWSSAQGFTGGRLTFQEPGRAISGTSDDQLYWANQINMSHWGTAVPNGTYDVSLLFAEIYWTRAGARVFDVSVEGNQVIDDLDVYATVGANRAYDRTFRVDVTDGKIDLEFSASANFPMVSAIEVKPVGSSGQPGSTNTGVPDGLALTPRWGDMTITTPGTRLDGIELHGFLDIKAPDVVVTRSIIRGRSTDTNRSLIHSTGARVTISDTTLLPSNPSVYVDGLKGYGFTATRLNVSGTVDTALIYGNDTTIQDSWLHDNVHYTADPNQGGTPSHDDGVQIQGGSNIRVRHNSISGAWNSAIQVTQDYAVTSNLHISDNWLAGGGCTVNIAQKWRGPILGLLLNDNRFARDSRLDCAVITPRTTPLRSWNNVWADSLTPVRIRTF